jgi:hypothetical protein
MVMHAVTSNGVLGKTKTKMVSLFDQVGFRADDFGYDFQRSFVLSDIKTLLLRVMEVESKLAGSVKGRLPVQVQKEPARPKQLDPIIEDPEHPDSPPLAEPGKV